MGVGVIRDRQRWGRNHQLHLVTRSGGVASTSHPRSFTAPDLGSGRAGGGLSWVPVPKPIARVDRPRP